MWDVWDVRGTYVPHLESLVAQRFQPFFRRVWDCGAKNTAYIREMYVCTFVRMYTRNAKNFLQIMSHSPTVTRNPL